MNTININSYDHAFETLRHPDLAQALYDAGDVIMKDVLLTLHGKDHRERRVLEMRMFTRNYFHYYETEIFPRTVNRTLEPFIAAGKGELIDVGYRNTMNLTADFAGIDRPEQSPKETETLLKLVHAFSEGATLVHSTRDHDDVKREVAEALEILDKEFLTPSLQKRRIAVEQVEKGELQEDELPRDLLTTLIRNEDRLPLPYEVLRREVAFFLQAGSHSTANSITHAMHEVFSWCKNHPEDQSKVEQDMIFVGMRFERREHIRAVHIVRLLFMAGSRLL